MSQEASKTQALTVREKTQQAIDQIRSDEITIGIREALPEGVNFRQFQRAAANALIANDKLADADRKSLIMATIRAAADGLLPDNREAAFVLYGNKVQYLPMIGGLRKIAA